MEEKRTEELKINLTHKYRLQYPPVGSGSQGAVFKATDTLLNRDVAIKKVNLQGFGKKEIEKIEAETLNYVKCTRRDVPVPDIYESFRMEGSYYIVMRWIGGKTLREIIDNSLYSPPKNLEYAKKLCRAVKGLHDMNIQHRDLKPENIKITKKGNLYLLDFGITAFMPRKGMGTDHYRPPELHKDFRHQVGEDRSDVFRIGVILYELFAGDTGVYVEAISGDKWEYFKPPSKKNQQINKDLNDIICRCMAYSIKDRYKNAGEILNRLKRVKL